MLNKDYKYKLSEKTRKKMKIGREGFHHSKETREKMKGMNSGKNNGNWVGNKISKTGLHEWVRRALGPASECFNCGKTMGQIDWANVDHSYKRNLVDWLSLCRSCHTIYDIKYNNRPGSNTGICSIPGCYRKHRAKGFCSMHYKRYRKGKLEEL